MPGVNWAGQTKLTNAVPPQKSNLAVPPKVTGLSIQDQLALYKSREPELRERLRSAEHALQEKLPVQKRDLSQPMIISGVSLRGQVDVLKSRNDRLRAENTRLRERHSDNSLNPLTSGRASVHDSVETRLESKDELARLSLRVSALEENAQHLKLQDVIGTHLSMKHDREGKIDKQDAAKSDEIAKLKARVFELEWALGWVGDQAEGYKANTVVHEAEARSNGALPSSPLPPVVSTASRSLSAMGLDMGRPQTSGKVIRRRPVVNIPKPATRAPHHPTSPPTTPGRLSPRDYGSNSSKTLYDGSRFEPSRKRGHAEAPDGQPPSKVATSQSGLGGSASRSAKSATWKNDQAEHSDVSQIRFSQASPYTADPRALLELRARWPRGIEVAEVDRGVGVASKWRPGRTEEYRGANGGGWRR